MGNSPKNVNAFTKNWRHVAPSLLRNQLTHQLIEQHVVSFASHDQQLFATQLLAKRIRLHHLHIVKLIYYAPENQICSCSPLDKPYRTQMYTEYPGDSLIGFLRVNNLPLKSKGCPCLSLLQGAMYLEKYYGPFELSEDRVFFDLQQLHEKQPTVKVWIHSDKAQNQPQRSCSQQAMVQSLTRLYSFMRKNGFCKNLTEDTLQGMMHANKLSQLKNQLTRGHNFEFQEESRQKKSYSAAQTKSKINVVTDKMADAFQVKSNGKPISAPYQGISINHSGYSMPLHSSQKKVTFNHNLNISQLKKKIQPETTRNKYDGQHFKACEGIGSTQATLPLVMSPKAINFMFFQNQGNAKQKNQRVSFNYMSTEVDRKNELVFKQEQKLIGSRDQPTNRNRVISNVESGYKNLAINSGRERTAINMQQMARIVNNVEFNSVQLPPKNSIKGSNLQRKQKHSLVHNQLPSFSTNPQNTISNSQPSVVITHPSATNSQQTIVEQSIASQNHHIQLQTTETIMMNTYQGFTASQMQLPLYQNQMKHLPSHLPTTSRSPKRGIEGIKIQPISEISQVIDSKESHTKGPKIIYPENLFSSRNSSRKPSLTNTISKNKKLQRYVKEIREYQESIRQRLSSSTGNKKFKGFVQHYENTLKPETRSDKPNQFKQTKSIYNDSEYRPMQASHQNLGFEVHQWQEADNIRRISKKQHQYPEVFIQEQNKYQKQAEQKESKLASLRQQIQERQYLKQAEDQREKDKKFQIERLKKVAQDKKKKIESDKDSLARQKQQKVELQRQARQKQQKIEMQKDLECEKKHIESQMNDLLRQNAMKDQYKSIREKVKQKKETFAQLKAEAAKILQDCLN